MADRIVTNSNGVSDDLKKTVSGSLDVVTIYNPIVSPFLIDQSRVPLNHPWFAENELPVVLGVGRFVPQKDFRLLIEAFRLLVERLPSRLVLLGRGPLRDELADLIEQYALGDKAVIIAADPNPWRYMARASVLAFTSVYEGFGNVLVEAMATGLPVISVDCPHGPAEILEDGKWGELVRSREPAAIADAIERSLTRDHDLSALRRRASDFSADIAAARYRDLITAAFAERK